jgi:GTP pyrophosphokinase
LHYGSTGDERLVEVSWGRQRDNTYPVDVEVMVYDRQGLLRDIASILANEKINVMAISTLSDKKASIGRIRLTLEIPNVATLSRVLTRIDRLPNVTAVRRMVH